MDFSTDQAVDRFVRALAERQQAWIVTGPQGIVTTRSPQSHTRTVAFMWSTRMEAERWADALTAAPRIECVSARSLLIECLPRLARQQIAIAADWSTDPIEPELAAPELARLLRVALCDEFVTVTRRTQSVWLLAHGDQLYEAKSTNGQTLVPAWASREEAFATAHTVNASGQQAPFNPLRVSLSDYNSRILVDIAARRARAAPAFIEAHDAVHFTPWDLKAELIGQSERLLSVA